MKYLIDGKFTVAASPTQKYRDNWEATFGEEPEPPPPPTEPEEPNDPTE